MMMMMMMMMMLLFLLGWLYSKHQASLIKDASKSGVCQREIWHKYILRNYHFFGGGKEERRIKTDLISAY